MTKSVISSNHKCKHAKNHIVEDFFIVVEMRKSLFVEKYSVFQITNVNNTSSDKAFTSTVVNRALSSLHGGAL